MKKLAVFALCTLMILSLTACGSKSEAKSWTSTPSPSR